MNKNSRFIVENYAFQIAKAFDIQAISQNTNLSPSTCRIILNKLKNEGKIETEKDRRRTLYMYVEARIKRSVLSGKNCNPRQEVLDKVIELQNQDLTHEEMAKRLNVSRSLVSMSFLSLRNHGILPRVAKDTNKLVSNVYLQRQKLRKLARKHNYELPHNYLIMSALELIKEIETLKSERR